MIDLYCLLKPFTALIESVRYMSQLLAIHYGQTENSNNPAKNLTGLGQNKSENQRILN